MEIVKRGEIPPLTRKRKKCRNCKSELIYTEADIKMGNDFEDFKFAYFNCPVCKEELYPSLLDKRVK